MKTQHSKFYSSKKYHQQNVPTYSLLYSPFKVTLGLERAFHVFSAHLRLSYTFWSGGWGVFSWLKCATSPPVATKPIGLLTESCYYIYEADINGLLFPLQQFNCIFDKYGTSFNYFIYCRAMMECNLIHILKYCT